MLRGHFLGVSFVGQRAFFESARPAKLAGFVHAVFAWFGPSSVPKYLQTPIQIELPVFILVGLGSVFAAVCFYRLRKKMPFVGAGMLSLGFLLWGIYLGTYPFMQEYPADLQDAGF